MHREADLDLLSTIGSLRNQLSSHMEDYLRNTFSMNSIPYKYLNDYPARPGKSLRPVLCLAACSLVGGEIKKALNTAAAIEFLHNSFLIKDDLVDGSDYRRYQETFNRKYGFEFAINAGDALNVLGMTPLIDNLKDIGVRKSLEIIREIHTMAKYSIEGQFMEIRWVKNNVTSLSPRDYLTMAEKKTCWYTCITPCRAGVIIGAQNVGEPDLEMITEFAKNMGLGFQIRDDVLNLTSPFNQYGKETNGDILEGKRTMMIIHLLNHCTRSERSIVKKVLEKKRSKKTSVEVKFIRNLMEKYDSIGFAMDTACRLVEKAKVILEEFPLSSNSQWRNFFFDLSDHMVQRNK
jgi:geranylgeranyl diphosphate synthase, type II